MLKSKNNITIILMLMLMLIILISIIVKLIINQLKYSLHMIVINNN